MRGYFTLPSVKSPILKWNAITISLRTESPQSLGQGSGNFLQFSKWSCKKTKYLIFSFARGLKNVIFFQAVKVLQFSILCFPISHSNTVCYSHRPLSRTKFCINRIIIRCRFFFLFIGRETTTLPVNDCLQIIVCSCAMASNCVRLQMIFCACVSETTFFSFLRSLLLEIRRSLRK